jgi:hypothetical protein
MKAIVRPDFKMLDERQRILGKVDIMLKTNELESHQRLARKTKLAGEASTKPSETSKRTDGGIGLKVRADAAAHAWFGPVR